MKSIYLSKIREQNPLIHNITNIVAANFSANGLLALGGFAIDVGECRRNAGSTENQSSVGH